MVSDRSQTSEHPDWLHDEQKFSKPATEARLSVKNRRIHHFVLKLKAFQCFSWDLGYLGQQAVCPNPLSDAVTESSVPSSLSAPAEHSRDQATVWMKGSWRAKVA
ncbi:hypothetical protein CSAL01_00125 [Colletotrichum salicis]|uniref:Uncharacterized protein n=1 Tax=Colletotrichum salicis TaxID=1209931 RepID=A0A135SQQ4_9PEZI|nr:hypothetical protein CSAL01_00125 [Colletotrichum salicis]